MTSDITLLRKENIRVIKEHGADMDLLEETLKQLDEERARGCSWWAR